MWSSCVTSSRQARQRQANGTHEKLPSLSYMLAPTMFTNKITRPPWNLSRHIILIPFSGPAVTLHNVRHENVRLMENMKSYTRNTTLLVPLQPLLTHVRPTLAPLPSPLTRLSTNPSMFMPLRRCSDGLSPHAATVTTIPALQRHPTLTPIFVPLWTRLRYQECPNHLTCH